MKVHTVDQQILASGGRTTGFDYMRIILSISVVGWHSIVTSYGSLFQDEVQMGLYRAPFTTIVPMFFVLSGFLVAGSLERCQTIFMFLGLRAIRIFLALCVEVMLSALLIGPLMTTLPLAQYFTDQKFLSYFLNIPGIIHYELPGLFINNPKQMTVNGQLWTIPFELYCYILIAILAVLGVARHRRIFLLVVVAFLVAGGILYMRKYGFSLERRPTGVPGFLLPIGFLLGIACYLFKNRLPWSPALGGLSLVASLVLLSLPPLGDFLAIFPLTYLTVFLGTANPKKIRLLRGADYSYGVFLYGYVIQQAWMSVGPSMHHWAINLALAIPTAIAVAALSWHLVEKPALGWRRYLAVWELLWIKLMTRFTDLLPPSLRRRIGEGFVA